MRAFRSRGTPVASAVGFGVEPTVRRLGWVLLIVGCATLGGCSSYTTGPGGTTIHRVPGLGRHAAAAARSTVPGDPAPPNFR